VYDGGRYSCWGLLSENAVANTAALEGADGLGRRLDPRIKLNLGMSPGLVGSGGGVRELFPKCRFKRCGMKVGVEAYGVLNLGLKMDCSCRKGMCIKLVG
jgi:hypothetical protein